MPLGRHRAGSVLRVGEGEMVPGVAGLLLTGGASRRMGVDKSSLLVGGRPLGTVTAELLRRVVSPVLEVGPGWTSLPSVEEEPRGGGPLVAIAAGAAALAGRGQAGPAVVVATDLPRLGLSFLHRLAAHPSDLSVVPVVAGHPQWLAARWSPQTLLFAQRLVAEGERQMAALDEDVEWLDEPQWTDQLVDVDTPADLERLGLRP